MKAADRPGAAPARRQAAGGRAGGGMRHAPRAQLADLLRAGRPAGGQRRRHAAGEPARHPPAQRRADRGAAGRPAHRSRSDDVREFTAIVFGAGDHRTRTEDRAAPPPLRAGDALPLGPLRATVLRTLGHPRLIDAALRRRRPTRSGPASRATASRSSTRTCSEPLALWDVWTRVAALPVAFEPPSAGFVLDWPLLHALNAARHRLCDADARRRHLVDRRCGARCAPAVRRALPHARSHGVGDRKAQVARRPRDRARHHRDARARARGLARRAARRRRRGRPAHRRATRGCAWSMRSSAARTSRARATTSCCAPSPRRRAASARARRLSGTATARTSSATRSARRRGCPIRLNFTWRKHAVQAAFMGRLAPYAPYQPRSEP